MKKTTKKTTKTGGKGKIKPRWKPGESGNPNGRSKGTRNYKTIFEESCRGIAETLRLGKEPDKIYVEIMKAGIRQMLRGNFNYYKDTMDRIFGKSVEKIQAQIKEKPKIDDEELKGFIKWRTQWKKEKKERQR